MEEHKINEIVDDINERSDDVRDILGLLPSWLVRWGTSIVFVIFGLIVLGSFIFRYDDVINARIVVTTSTPPIHLKAKTAGKLNNIFVKPNEFVQDGHLLAEIENNADFKDVYYLEKQLKETQLRIIDIDSLEIIYPSNLKLGSIQIAYIDFVGQYQSFLLYNELNPKKKEINALSRQISEQVNQLSVLKNRQSLFKKELEISEVNYNRNKKMYDKGVISRVEYETAQRDFLSDKREYETITSTISDINVSIARVESNKIQSKIEDTEFAKNYYQDLLSSLQNLENSIDTWEQANILKSPIDGKVTLFDVWNKYQNTEVGDVLFTIVPQKIDSLVGRVLMPVLNSGKVKTGQEVIIKLDNYPYAEWGSIKGKIVTISEVPKQDEDVYSIQVLIEGLETSFGKTLEFKQEMRGSAEIVTEELTLIERIFYQFRELFR